MTKCKSGVGLEVAVSAGELPPMIGRGAGMTLKDILEHMKAAERLRGIGSQRWRLRVRMFPVRHAAGCVRVQEKEAVWKEKLKRIVAGIRKCAEQN